MVEFSIGENYYSSGKLNAFQQFHVARKLGPILVKMGPVAAQALSNPDAGIDLLGPVLEALAEMSEEDCNFVLSRCLSVVKRRQGNGPWAAVWHDGAKRLLFEDIDMPVMIQIAMQVIGDNLGSFLGAPGSILAPQPPVA